MRKKPIFVPSIIDSKNNSFCPQHNDDSHYVFNDLTQYICLESINTLLPAEAAQAAFSVPVVDSLSTLICPLVFNPLTQSEDIYFPRNDCVLPGSDYYTPFYQSQPNEAQITVAYIPSAVLFSPRIKHFLSNLANSNFNFYSSVVGIELKAKYEQSESLAYFYTCLEELLANAPNKQAILDNIRDFLSHEAPPVVQKTSNAAFNCSGLTKALTQAFDCGSSFDCESPVETDSMDIEDEALAPMSETPAKGGIRYSYFALDFQDALSLPKPMPPAKPELPEEDTLLSYRLTPLKDTKRRRPGLVSYTRLLPPKGTESAYQYDLFWKSAEHASTSDIRQAQVSFVMAARLEEALVPDLSQENANTRVFLVLTSAEYQDLKHCDFLLPYDCLIIRNIAGYPNKGALSCRRLAAWIAAERLGLSDFIMIDDNLTLLQYHRDFLGKAETLGWTDLYRVLQRHSDSSQISCLSVFNRGKKMYPDQRLQETKDSLGSKFFFFDWSSISPALNKKKGGVFNLAYTPAQCQQQYWGEDYFFQLYLQALSLTMQLKKSPYGILNEEAMGFFRKRTVSGETDRISCLSQGILAKALSTDPKECYFPPYKKDKLRQEAIRALNRVIARNEQHVRSKLSIASKTDLLEKHKKANPLYKTVAHRPLVLKDHQTKTLAAVQEAILAKEPHGLSSNGYIELFTGSGKTLIQIELSRWVISEFSQGNVIIVEPTLDLVNQYYRRFLESLPENDILRERLIKVSSNPTDVHKTFLSINKSLNDTRHIYIFCEPSLIDLIKCYPKASLLSTCKLLLLDEFHKYSSEARAADLRDWFVANHVHCYGFTATVPVENPLFPKQKPLIHFNLYDGIERGICAPVIIDNLTWAYEDKNNVAYLKSNIYQFLSNCIHPNGGNLLDKKGIIFLPNIPEIREMKQNLCFGNYPKNRIFEVHYQTDRHTLQNNLLCFNQLEPHEKGVILASQMLRVGFDPKQLDYIVNFQKSEESNNFLQILGRVLRKNADCPNKVGYLIKLNYAVHFNASQDRQKSFYQPTSRGHLLFSGYFSGTGKSLAARLDPDFLNRTLAEDGSLYVATNEVTLSQMPKPVLFYAPNLSRSEDTAMVDVILPGQSINAPGDLSSGCGQKRKQAPNEPETARAKPRKLIKRSLLGV